MENLQLTADGREAKRAYDRAWERAHKEQRRANTAKKREYNIRFWNKRGAELAAQRQQDEAKEGSEHGNTDD